MTVGSCVALTATVEACVALTATTEACVALTATVEACVALTATTEACVAWGGGVWASAAAANHIPRTTHDTFRFIRHSFRRSSPAHPRARSTETAGNRALV